MKRKLGSTLRIQGKTGKQKEKYPKSGYLNLFRNKIRSITRREDTSKVQSELPEKTLELKNLKLNQQQLIINSILAIFALAALIVSIIALKTLVVIISRDEGTQTIVDAGKHFGNEEYEQAYALFNSAWLSDNPISLAYLGYMKSKGLGCEKDLYLSNYYYRKAIDGGMEGCKTNILYNTITNSPCYYEITDAILVAFDEGNPDSIIYLANCVGHSYVMPGLESMPLQQMYVAIQQYYSMNEKERRDCTVEMLVRALNSNYDDITIEDNTQYTIAAAPNCNVHEICCENPIYMAVVIQTAIYKPFPSAASTVYPLFQVRHRSFKHVDLISEYLPQL